MRFCITPPMGSRYRCLSRSVTADIDLEDNLSRPNLTIRHGRQPFGGQHEKVCTCCCSGCCRVHFLCWWSRRAGNHHPGRARRNRYRFRMGYPGHAAGCDRSCCCQLIRSTFWTTKVAFRGHFFYAQDLFRRPRSQTPFLHERRRTLGNLSRLRHLFDAFEVQPALVLPGGTDAANRWSYETI